MKRAALRARCLACRYVFSPPNPIVRSHESPSPATRPLSIAFRTKKQEFSICGILRNVEQSDGSSPRNIRNALQHQLSTDQLLAQQSSAAMAPLPPSSDGDWQCFVQWERYRAPLIQLSSPAPTAIQQLADEWAQIPNKKTLADAVHKVQRALEDEQKAGVRLQVRRAALEAEDEAVSRLVELSRNRVKEGLQSLLESREILARDLRALQKVQGALISERSRKYTAELLEKTDAAIEEVQAELSAFQRRPSRDSHDRDTARGSKRRNDDDTSDGDDDDDASGFGNKRKRSAPKAPKLGSTHKSGSAGKQGQEDADDNGQPDIFGAGQTHAADGPGTSPKPRIQPPRSSHKYQYRPNSSGSDRRPNFYQYAPSSSGAQEAAVDIPVVANANEEGLEPRESSVMQEDDGQKMDDEVADNEEPNGEDDAPDPAEVLLRAYDASPACVVWFEALDNSGLTRDEREKAGILFWDLVDIHGRENENWGLAPLIYDYGYGGHPVIAHIGDSWIEDEDELDEAFTSGWQKAISDFEKKSPGSNLMALMRDRQREADEHYQQYGERIFAPVLRESDTITKFVLRVRVKIDEEKKEALIRSWNQEIRLLRDKGLNKSADEAKNTLDEVMERWYKKESVWRPDEDPPQSDHAISFDAGADKIGFDGERSGLEGNWVFARELGGGGHGQATLWESFDQHNGLRTQLVIKQVYVPDQWHDEHNSIWYGDSSNNRPKEFAFNRILALLHGSDNIVNVYSYATYEALEMYRIYMGKLSVEQSSKGNPR